MTNYQMGIYLWGKYSGCIELFIYSLKSVSIIQMHITLLHYYFIIHESKNQ